jgi:hypothetical protein
VVANAVGTLLGNAIVAKSKPNAAKHAEPAVASATRHLSWELRAANTDRRNMVHLRRLPFYAFRGISQRQFYLSAAVLLESSREDLEEVPFGRAAPAVASPADSPDTTPPLMEAPDNEEGHFASP